MAARSLCRALTESGFAALIPSLVSSANLDTLLERPRSLIYDKKRGPRTDPRRTLLQTAVQSEGTPLTMTLCLLPANQFSIHAATLPWMPRARTFLMSHSVRDFIEGFAEVQKDYIHGPRTVTLTEHVLVKVKEVCNTRPTLTKTVLARVYEVICLQEIDHPVLDDKLKDFFWDGGQADGSVVSCISEETLFGMG